MTLLVVMALSNVRLVRTAWTEVNPDWDTETALERFDPVVRDLPPGTEVNYVSAARSNVGVELSVARFALSPLQVVVGSQRDWVIVNSHSPLPGLDIEPRSVRRVADYGSGVRLFVREETP